MRVLVTGATGNLGRSAVTRLIEEGHQVSVLTRRPFQAADLFGAGVSVHEWHPLSEAVPAEALDSVDAVLHLMGAPLCGSQSRDAAKDVVASRIYSARGLAEALKRRQVRLVATSIAIAPAEAGPPVTEDLLPANATSSLERDIRSYEAELEAATGDGLSVAIVRLGLVAMRGGPLAALMALARRGLCPNLKGALIPAIAREDAVAMLAGLLQHRTLEGLIHGVAPMPVEGEALMAALRPHAPGGRFIAVPISLLRRRLGLAAALLSCHRQVVPQRLQAAGAAFAAPDPMPAFVDALTEIADARTGAPAPFRAAENGKGDTAPEPEAT